jgi:D-glycero-D-manno-heptose 1,7-bisphosphate phosphatase
MTKIIFTDRDGVINEFPGMGNYVTRWDQFRFLPKAVEALALLTRAGYEIHVISNQGCVSRGLVTREDLEEITRRMEGEIQKAGGKLAGVFYCLHQVSDHCDCKKPKTSLFEKALKGRAVPRREIYFIGDTQEDIEASRNLGCQSVLVLSGKVKEEGIGRLNPPPEHVKKDLWDAAQWILAKKS